MKRVTWAIASRALLEGNRLDRGEQNYIGNPEHVGKLRNILATLNAASTVAHMDLPSFRLHPLKGEMKDFWAVTVRANWRVIFRFDEGVEDVDYVDYH